MNNPDEPRDTGNVRDLFPLRETQAPVASYLDTVAQTEARLKALRVKAEAALELLTAEADSTRNASTQRIVRVLQYLMDELQTDYKWWP